MIPFIVLDTRHKLETPGEDFGKYHVKIKASIPVIVNGEKTWPPRRALTGVYVTKSEYTSLIGSPRSKILQEKKKIVDEKLLKAKTICEIKGITPDRYIQLMDSAGSFENVTGMFDYYIGECLKENKETGEARDGHAITLNDAKRFFCRYKLSTSVGFENITEELIKNCHISYAEITKEWLEYCKSWAFTEIRIKDKDDKERVIKVKLSPASLYMYYRALRTVMNLAVDPFKKITKDEVPFGKEKNKFKIPSSSKKKRKVKLDLSLDELNDYKNKILSHKSNRPKVNKALNYWKASFFGNGANMADVLRWRIGDVTVLRSGEKIILFERKKTENTEEDNEAITVVIGPELQEIINIEGNKSLDPEEYVFPVLKKGMSSAERKQAIIDFIDFMNKRLKTARKEMKLEIKLTSSSSRYLMSTLLDRAGIPKAVIKELLGHGSESMQAHYVSPYVLELRKQINGILSVAK